MKWSFNRLKDSEKIERKIIEWKGPFSWPNYESKNNLPKTPDVEGIYLWTFKYKDGYVVYTAGITNSTKKRLRSHTYQYQCGRYNVLDIAAAENGERKEIWHGWQYAKTHQDEYLANKSTIDAAIENQLLSYRVFIAEISDKRKRERLESSIMHNIYLSKEPWSELADRGMYLKVRENCEMPIEAKNISESKIYGLPELLEF